MRDFKGYCLEGKRIIDVSSFLEGFRKAGQATLSRRFHALVADEAVRLIDLHRVGLGSAQADDHPLKVAAATVRAKGLSGLDCLLDIIVISDTILIRIKGGEAIYAKAVSGIPGVRELRWPPLPGQQVAVKEQSRVQALLQAAVEAPVLSARLLDWPTPKLRGAAIPGLIPERRVRLQRTASVVIWMNSSHRKNGDNEGFKRWLRSDGASALKVTMSNVDRELPISFDKEDLTRFGQRRVIQPIRRKNIAAARPDTEIRAVDHADVVRGNDGRTIVAVWHAGFSPRDRIMLMLYGTTLGFTQSGRDFGQIISVPTAAVAALRSGDEVHVVEVRRHDGKTEVVGNHAAILMDMSSDDDHLSTAQHWHTRPVASTAGNLGTRLK